MNIKINGYEITGTPAEMAAFLFICDEMDEKQETLTDQEEKKVNVKPNPKKKDFDVNKAKALRDAGWTLAKIADEMRVSPQTVANKLKEAAA